MSKFNNGTAVKSRPARSSFIKSTDLPLNTFEGGSGVAREAKSELFLLAVSDFVSEGSFYETSSDRDTRLVELSRDVAVDDVEWTTDFVTWLRGTANMRSAALVVALEGAYGLNRAGVPGGRTLVSAAMLRADEPGEAIAYWHAKHGRNLPKSVKRGIADATKRLYTERSVGKYDTNSKPVRFGDVLTLTHPKPEAGKQSTLFKYLLDRRFDAKAEVPEELRTLTHRRRFFSLSDKELAELVKEPYQDLNWLIKFAQLSWEDVAGNIPGGMTASVWEALIPQMGYMALIRNLRNFIEAGVSDKTLDEVAARIMSEEEVAKSRQLPFRFYSAYKATRHSSEFYKPLERALGHSLKNVPSLSGSTLILVDRSGSMFWSHSSKTEATLAESAALFGTALALRAEDATLVQFGTTSSQVKLPKGSSVLGALDKFTDLGGTNTSQAVYDWYHGHDRVIVVTDEQHRGWGGDPYASVPTNIPVYTWNLEGYGVGTKTGPNRHTFGGLSDSSFNTISLLEASRVANWPWL